MANTTFQISSYENLLHTSVAGTLSLPEIYRLDKAFWAVFDNHDRILMDYTNIQCIDISVAEFTQAGIASQVGTAPSGSRIMAAYVATDPNVYAFARIIEEVWSSHLLISVWRSQDDALQWLGFTPAVLRDMKIESTG